ncbi:bifunctional metallophosphatase/5'-nucleotidase [bacterium]|nr:bifunctional metallophosphatase/5'-nucleotidase [bacterium]
MEIQGFSSAPISSYTGRVENQPQVKAQSEESAAPLAQDQVSLEGENKPAEGTVSLRLLHINDVHGAAVDEGGRGGLAKAATVIERERENAPGQVLTLNAGDLAEGSMVSYLTKGGVISEAMAQIGFDAIEPGNHDFAWGQQDLQQMLADTHAPIINASITREDGSTFGEPFMVKDVGGVKVGILGLDVENMARYVSDEKLEGLTFNSSAATLEKFLPKMKEAGADVIMVLSHIGFDEDKKIAQQFPEIDVIVGGHSHTELPEGHYEGNTLIVQAGTKGQYVGEVDLSLDLGTKKIAAADARLIPVDESVEPDPEVAAIIQASMDSVAEIGSKVMGQATEDLSFSYWEAGKVNQIHADSVLEATGADISFVSSRNPRGSIQAGEVTYEELFNAFPHTEEDVVVMKDVPGSLLIAEMETRVGDNGRGPVTPGGFSYTYDVSQPEGSRCVDIRMKDGSKMDPNGKYTVATTISMARKSAFKGLEKQTIGSSQEIFMKYFEKGGTWSDNPDNRVTKIGTQEAK